MRVAGSDLLVRIILRVVSVATRSASLHRWPVVLRSLPHGLRLQSRELKQPSAVRKTILDLSNFPDLCRLKSKTAGRLIMPAVRHFHRDRLAAAGEAASRGAASCEAMASFTPASNVTMVGRASALKPAASITAAFKAATVGASIVAMSIAVEPGACADKSSARKVAWTVVSIGCTRIRIIRIVAVGADGRTGHVASDADPNSDPSSNHDCGLRVRDGQSQ